MAGRRVVITGMGAVTPLGHSVPVFWEGLSAGRCGIGPITSINREGLSTPILAEVRGFDPRAHFAGKHLLQADRYTQLAAAAAHEAMAMAGLAEGAGHRPAACVVGTGIGGQGTQEAHYRKIFGEGGTRVHPLTILRVIGSSAAGHLSIEFGLTGPAFGVMSACASGAHAIGLVSRMVREGMVPFGLAGGTEATLTWGTVKAWESLRVLSNTGCRPFSKSRDGLVLGEGAAMVVLEAEERAHARGAPVLGVAKGFGMTADAADMLAPSEEGPVRAMTEAIEDAGLAPDAIEHVNAHGTGTTANDVAETRAIRSVFGRTADAISISATKSMHGHGLGAGGAMEAVASLMALRESFVPPTINLDVPDPQCDLDYTPAEGRRRRMSYALSNSFAFGGMNAVLVFGHPDAE